MRTRTALPVSLAAALLLFAGCGDDENGGGDGTSLGGAVPECADLDGETMTDNYEGCLVEDEIQSALIYDDCEDGRSLIVSGPVYGYVDEPIIYSPEDGGVDGAGFQKLWNECYGYEDEVESEDVEPSAEGEPPLCDDVWKIGQTLPADYRGCVGQEGISADVGVDCIDGTTLYVLENPETGDDQYFGVTGQEISNADDGGADDAPYAAAYAACVG